MTIIDSLGYRRWIEQERIWAYSCYYRRDFDYSTNMGTSGHKTIFNDIKRNKNFSVTS